MPRQVISGVQMDRSKVLSDLVTSAAGAKAHYDVWWALTSDAAMPFFDKMDEHSDFFRTSRDAHYNACFIYLGHLFDKRKEASSLPTYIKLLKKKSGQALSPAMESRFHDLRKRVAPLMTIRHGAIAHVNSRLSESDIFAPLNITWNEIRSRIYDAANFVTELAGASHPGAVGIPRNGRLGDATLKLLRALN